MNRLLFVVALGATIAAIVCGLVAHRLSKDNSRLERNQQALLESVEFYRTAAGESAASVGVLELEVEEFRRQRREDAAEIRNLGIRLRRAESYAESVMATTLTTTLEAVDTVYVRDTLRDTVVVFRYDDAWTRLDGRLRGDSVDVALHSVDTLHQVVHRVPRKFLFFRFGTKAIRQEVWLSNPNTELVYTEYIELKK